MNEEELRQIRWDNKILWSCAFGMGVGFSNTSETMIPELEALGYDIYVDDWFGATSPVISEHLRELYYKYQNVKDKIDFTEYPHVVNFIMESFWQAKGKYKIGGCFVESTKLKEKYVEIVNNMDYLFTSCDYNRQIEIKSGVTKPIFIVPPYTDNNTYHYMERNHQDRPYTFLHVGVIQERKNTHELLECYMNAFPDDGKTKLIVKSNHFGGVEYSKNLTKGRNDVEYIYTNEKPLSTQEMVDLYASADCYINLSHGEGTGMPEVEAMATGLPVITSNWDARKTFIDESVGWMIKVAYLDKAYKQLADEDCGEWAQYDLNNVVDLMRTAYNNPAEAKHRGLNGAERIKYKFSAKKAAQGFDAIFMDIYNKKRNNNV